MVSSFVKLTTVFGSLITIGFGLRYGMLAAFSFTWALFLAAYIGSVRR
jgi:hypothetical protein